MTISPCLKSTPRTALALTAAVLAAGFSLAGTSQADASTVGKSAGTISVQGTAGPDKVNVGLIGGPTYLVHHGWYFFKGASAGSGCVFDFHRLAAACHPRRVSAITFDGYAGNDRMSASAVGIQTNFRGGSGDDVLTAGTRRATLLGGPGNDKLRGGPRGDFISGEGGDDEIGGFEGNDVLAGGFGNDGISGGPGNDQIVGGGGTIDVMDGGPGEDQLWGQPENTDTFWTNDGERDVVDCLGGFNNGMPDGLDELTNC